MAALHKVGEGEGVVRHERGAYLGRGPAALVVGVDEPVGLGAGNPPPGGFVGDAVERVRVEPVEVVYDFRSPRVQFGDDMVLLTYQLYANTNLIAMKNKCIELYQKEEDSQWRLIHSTWSFMRPGGHGLRLRGEDRLRTVSTPSSEGIDRPADGS